MFRLRHVRCASAAGVHPRMHACRQAADFPDPRADLTRKSLPERNICTKLIVPASPQAGWDIRSRIREEVTITKDSVTIRGKLHTRGKARRADIVHYQGTNHLIAVIEAKDDNHCVGEGMQQVLDYAESLDVTRSPATVTDSSQTIAAVPAV